MISIICVYNDKRSVDIILKPSLDKQTLKHEEILLDNTRNTYPSAAWALSYGAGQARGDYLMFIHQDVELPTETWLENTERWLNSLGNFGIAGVIGKSKEGFVGQISNCGEIFGRKISKPEKVQILDECLFIIPRGIFSYMQFDNETFDGWHCYGADYCLACKRQNIGVYAIPEFIYHRSTASNIKSIEIYHKRIANKYREINPIYLTTGTLYNGIPGIIYNSAKAIVKHSVSKYEWINDVKEATKECNSLLDIGCGYNSIVSQLNIKETVGVDNFEPYLEESRKKAIHTKYIQNDIRKIEFPSKSFDVVLCSEVIEHLDKNDGIQLIKNMELWARKKVIITTPNGFLPQDIYDENKGQTHLSGWTVGELKNAGFKIKGLSGWKYLTIGYNHPRFNPSFICNGLAGISENVTKIFPKFAFQLLAIKSLEREEIPAK